ncbi:unnamed protein product [Protopolystoma xenopodis]|uniref:Uncharacterized protein n=1 Tax=Protopolystoma xenopodis TaxID=117903 RepID=A0A448X527_9PLAT|nr:unnamed protein product [Protopolystoma xenopodis]
MLLDSGNRRHGLHEVQLAWRTHRKDGGKIPSDVGGTPIHVQQSRIPPERKPVHGPLLGALNYVEDDRHHCRRESS